MCVIAKGLKKDMRRDEIVACMESNPYGFFLYDSNGPRTVRTLDMAEALAFYDSVPDDSTVVLHARIPSVGANKTLQNVHGWDQCEYMFCHNGTLRDVRAPMALDPAFKDRTDSEFLFRTVVQPLASCSHITGRGAAFDALLDLYARATGSKFLLIAPDGAIRLYGEFIEDHGVMYSNQSYRTASYRAARPPAAAAQATSRALAQGYLPLDVDTVASLKAADAAARLVKEAEARTAQAGAKPAQAGAKPALSAGLVRQAAVSAVAYVAAAEADRLRSRALGVASSMPPSSEHIARGSLGTLVDALTCAGESGASNASLDARAVARTFVEDCVLPQPPSEQDMLMACAEVRSAAASAGVAMRLEGAKTANDAVCAVYPRGLTAGGRPRITVLKPNALFPDKAERRGVERVLVGLGTVKAKAKGKGRK